MTVAQEVLVDPAEAEFARATRDPLDILTPGERAEAERMIADGERASTVAQAAIVLGGAFLLYRSYMVRKLRRVANPTVTRVMMQTASDYYWRQFFPTWVLVAGPALHGAAGAALDLKTGDVPDELLFALADDYAERLGRYLHASSNEALLEGFSANLNKRMPRQVAAQRALDGMALSQRQMRALQATKAPPPVSSVQNLNPDVRSQAYIEQALLTRAKAIGENEAFAVSQEGKQLGWMYRQSKGLLPADTKRMWVTARDEKVCKVCGPMHRKTVPLNKPFETKNGKMWAPGAHPNCRCEITLKVPITEDVFVRKDLQGTALAVFNREHPRATDGTFTTKTKTEAFPKVSRVETPQVVRVDAPKVTRVQVTPQVTTSVTTQAPQVSAPQVTLPAAVLLQAIAAIPEQKQQVQQVVAAQAQTTPVQQKTEVKTKAPAKEKTKVTYRHKIAESYAVDDEYMGDVSMREFVETRFTSYDKAVSKAYEITNQRIADRVEELMDRGVHQQTVVFPDGTVHEEPLTKDEMYAFVEAEVYALPHSPGRAVAQEWGVDRKDFIVNVYRIGEIDTSRTEGDTHAYRDNDEWEVSGTYAVEYFAHQDGPGVPMITNHMVLDAPPKDEQI